MSVIQLNNLSKTYRVHKKEPGLTGTLKALVKRKYENVLAVRNISFQISEGELVGFIGPNGAGKTTTLKMLSGLLYPTSGKISVLGHTPWERSYEFLTDISLIMGQKNQLWWDLPPIESFQLNKEIYNLKQSQYKKTLGILVDMLDLSAVLNVQVRKLSLGQRMKAELVAALLHQPKVLFLDEPTIGLDVIMQKTLRDFIRNYNREFKASIILTSHYMEDVKELCKRIIIIDKGKVIYDGLLQEIITKYADHKIIEVTFANNVTKKDLKLAIKPTSFKNNQATFQVSRSKVAQFSSQLLQTLPVTDIEIKEPKIEDVIRQVFTTKTK